MLDEVNGKEVDSVHPCHVQVALTDGSTAIADTPITPGPTQVRAVGDYGGSIMEFPFAVGHAPS